MRLFAAKLMINWSTDLLIKEKKYFNLNEMEIYWKIKQN